MKTVVVVAIAIVVVEVERTCVSVVVVASTFEKRIIVAVVDTYKIRVRSGISTCFSLKCTRTKSNFEF